MLFIVNITPSIVGTTSGDSRERRRDHLIVKRSGGEREEGCHNVSYLVAESDR